MDLWAVCSASVPCLCSRASRRVCMYVSTRLQGRPRLQGCLHKTIVGMYIVLFTCRYQCHILLCRWCRCGNQEIYRRLRLIPRVMRNVADVSMETSMLGQQMSFPVYISAAAKGGLAHAEGEEALCRAAFAKQTIQMCPHMATKTLEQAMPFFLSKSSMPALAQTCTKVI